MFTFLGLVLNVEVNPKIVAGLGIVADIKGLRHIDTVISSHPDKFTTGV